MCEDGQAGAIDSQPGCDFPKSVSRYGHLHATARVRPNRSGMKMADWNFETLLNCRS
jgi:hypothetical protein